MEHIRNEIISCLNTFSDDEELIDALGKIIKIEGQRACQVIFHVLTHLDMEAKEAFECWQKIIDHRQTLSEKVGRSVNIRTAICDFFCTVSAHLKNPKVVEIHVFERAYKTSRYDALTGLFNRLAFEDEIARELSRAMRYDTDLSFLFFDLDDFKSVNDTYGHQAGDLVLKRVAAALLNGKRAEDLAVRYGGEELALILPKTDKYSALMVGDRICNDIAALDIEFEGSSIPITVSGGLSTYPIDASNSYHLIQGADEALYRAKQEGKNRVCLFTTNKRRYSRLKVDIPLKLKIIGSGEIPNVEIRSKDFSLNGILFEYHTPIELGTKIQLELPINAGETQVQIVGTVVRIEAFSPELYDIGISISFKEMEYASKDLLSKWYHSLKETQENG